MRADNVIELYDVDGRPVRVTEGAALEALATALENRTGGDIIASSALTRRGKVATISITPIEAQA